jgi:hypothetical protein
VHQPVINWLGRRTELAPTNQPTNQPAIRHCSTIGGYAMCIHKSITWLNLFEAQKTLKINYCLIIDVYDNFIRTNTKCIEMQAIMIEFVSLCYLAWSMFFFCWENERQKLWFFHTIIDQINNIFLYWKDEKLIWGCHCSVAFSTKSGNSAGNYRRNYDNVVVTTNVFYTL